MPSLSARTCPGHGQESARDPFTCPRTPAGGQPGTPSPSLGTCGAAQTRSCSGDWEDRQPHPGLLFADTPPPPWAAGRGSADRGPSTRTEAPRRAPINAHARLNQCACAPLLGAPRLPAQQLVRFSQDLPGEIRNPRGDGSRSVIRPRPSRPRVPEGAADPIPQPGAVGARVPRVLAARRSRARKSPGLRLGRGRTAKVRPHVASRCADSGGFSALGPE